jgi:deoxycytidine triphosphate deaminase
MVRKRIKENIKYMIYSDNDILAAIKVKTIKISPYNVNQLGVNSYDVCLGNTFYEVFWDGEGPYFVGPYVYLDGEKVNVPVGGTLLGVTKERIGTSGKVVAELRSRSSIRRVGIDPCMAAGWGDVGYNNVWVMEFTSFIRSHSAYSPYLTVGQAVAQMVFMECKTEPARRYDGQYQADWPLNMIPRKYRHRVNLPNK